MPRKKPSSGVETGKRKLQGHSNWIELFAPTESADLAVHYQKIETLNSWIKNLRQNSPSILLLTGPTGSAKSVCLHTLANENGYEVCEWISPTEENSEYDKQSEREKFVEFLFKASRYQSIFNKQSRRLLLVEDFPNILLQQKDLLVEILANYRATGKSPLAFIASDTKSKSLDISYNLFPESVRSQFGIHAISFNPISVTLMKKALSRIIVQLKEAGQCEFQEPSSDVLDGIIVSSQGDIRNAILNLQMVSQKNVPKMELESLPELSNKEHSQKRPKKSKGVKKLKEVGRDETISLMHGIGRVFNPKRNDNGHLTHSPEVLTDMFTTQPNSFLSCMFNNYVGHFSSIEDCKHFLNDLTVADNFLQEYREPTMPQTGLNTAIRGAMVANQAPVHAWLPLKGNKFNYNLENECSSNYMQFVTKCIQPLITRNVFTVDIKNYSNLIVPRIGNDVTDTEMDDEMLNLIETIESEEE